MRRRRNISFGFRPFELELMIIGAAVGLGVMLLVMLVGSSLCWDKLIVPGYKVDDFVRTVELLGYPNRHTINVVGVTVSGPPKVAGYRRIRSRQDLYALAEESRQEANAQMRVSSVSIRGRLSYYQFAQLQKLGEIKEIQRSYVLPMFFYSIMRP